MPMPSNPARGSELQKILRHVVRMDPLAAELATRWSSEMTQDEAICYFTGRLHGALFQLGQEKLEFAPIYDAVEAMIKEDSLIVAKPKERP